MQIRCPHCQNPIEVVQDDSLTDVDCPSCGSSFNLASDAGTITYEAAETVSVAHFKLIEQIGTGTFGTVWKARDTELDRIVAVKIPRQSQVDEARSETFLREARAAAQLSHPNIVTVHEVGRQDDTLYIVSDFVEGISLADWLTGQQVTAREAVELCVTIAGALRHAHEQGVTHRDLKPSNIMLDTEGQPHVMDFGLAKREAGEITMTVEGKVLGTPAYMPPEQARGEGHHADARSDVYSLGVILFELLAGDLPFRGNQRMLLHQVIHEEPPSPRKLNGTIPRDLETITLKCLEKDASRRYQTAQALADDLTHWLDGEPITARPVTWMERSWRWCRRKPAVAGLCAIISLLLLTLGVSGMIFGNREASLRRDADDARDDEVKQRKLATDKAAEAESERKKAVVAEKKATDNFKTAERNAYNSDMLLAQRDWEDANIGHLRELLDRHRDRDDLKGFEWDYWNRLLKSDLLTLKGHSNPVYSVSFSPDGKRIVSGSGDNTLKVWDAQTGQETLTHKGHSYDVFSVSFSPDGKRIVSGSLDNTLKVWDAQTGQETLTLKGHSSTVSSVSFSPDGKRIVSGSYDNTLKVWDARPLGTSK